ncbi:predicted protein [Naegleria gruberi]|uniref:Predicted protein n=1 Tax=Naegleria gruberi TaxID=5762 RepID=D2V2P6_NAEGR|nr:uncharacterized protein NAEGRDRAFT_63072 [Naegleria gruberi]EFC48931.1 predicted protein [Naegleria gruberi]|eukprot:XP_002681675.1 predicted protein [Naegleria gruberi strain NEG-M]
MVNDILPEEAGICLGLQHHGSEILMTNDWSWEQQTFLSVCSINLHLIDLTNNKISNKLSTELDNLYGTSAEIEKKTTPSPYPTTKQLEQLCQNIFSCLFSHGDIKAKEKSQLNINYSFKVIFITKCVSTPGIDNELKRNFILPLASIFEKQFELFKNEVRNFMSQPLDSGSAFTVLENQRKAQLYKLFSTFDEEELRKVTCTLDLIEPLVENFLIEACPDIDPNQPLKFNCSSLTPNLPLESLSTEPISSLLRTTRPVENTRFWQVERDSMERVIREKIAQKQYGLILISVQGIPMRDACSEGTNNYDVLLACKGLTVDIIQDVSVSSGSINLRWVRADPKRSIEHLYTTKSVHRITPMTPYTLPTVCLMRHLSTKKPVALIYESEYNLAHNHSPTHLILQHGHDVYLHVLHLNKVFQPYTDIIQNEENNLRYRTHEFIDIVNNHLLRVNVKRDLAREGTTIQETEKESLITLMKHNNCVYSVPSSIERGTRYFPLAADDSSVLFCENAREIYATLFSKIITPLMDILLRKAPEYVNDQDKIYVEKLLESLFEFSRGNDEQLIPELKNDHTKRWNSYRKIWGELRAFFLTIGYKEFTAVMDRLWPQFLYDKQQQGDDSTGRRAKRVVEVQRDRYGAVIFPIPLGALTVLSLGKVIYDRPNYHTDKYIWPVGYKSTRYYTSVKDTNRRCLYTCEIKDGGESPIFVLSSDDNPNDIIEAPSATAAWTAIVKQINKIKSEESGKRVFTNVSGPEYFGLAHPTIMKLISQLPNAEKINRPNYAPNQPVKTESSINDPNASSDDENITPPSANMTPSASSLHPSVSQTSLSSQLQQATPTLSASPETNNGDAQTPDLARKRAKRNEQVHYERDTTRSEIQKVSWLPNMNLAQFCENRSNKLVAKPMDGENEGEKGLYSYLNLNNANDRSSNQQGSSSNANHQQGSSNHYGSNRNRKYGQKRKFALYQ